MKNSVMKRILFATVMISMATAIPFTRAVAQDPSVEPQQVIVDVKPSNCVDPVNTKSRGILTVVLLGSADFDVTKVDVDSIVLGATDVVDTDPGSAATPVRSVIRNQFIEGDCGVQGGQDGFNDLILQFRTQNVVGSLTGLRRGKNPNVEVKLIGNFTADSEVTPADGTTEDDTVIAQDFEGLDSILVINNIKKVRVPKVPKRPRPRG